MALVCGSTTVTYPSTSAPPFSSSKSSNTKSPSLGLQLALSKSSIWSSVPVISRDIWNKTCYPKAADHVNTDQPWYIVDATDKIVGRLASTIAVYIRGKNLATYTPSGDMGAFVIAVNAEKIVVSGKKWTQKLYRRHSGRPTGMKVETLTQLQQRLSERIIEHAVRCMLPKGRLGRQLFTHLKVYKALNSIELPIRDKRIRKSS